VASLLDQVGERSASSMSHLLPGGDDRGRGRCSHTAVFDRIIAIRGRRSGVRIATGPGLMSVAENVAVDGCGGRVHAEDVAGRAPPFRARAQLMLISFSSVLVPRFREPGGDDLHVLDSSPRAVANRLDYKFRRNDDGCDIDRLIDLPMLVYTLRPRDLAAPRIDRVEFAGVSP